MVLPSARKLAAMLFLLFNSAHISAQPATVTFKTDLYQWFDVRVAKLTRVLSCDSS